MSVLAKRDEQKLIKIKESGTTLDRIWGNLAFGDDAIILTAKEIEIKKRYELAWHYLCEFKSVQESVQCLLDDYPGLSQAQAYRDIANTKRLFGDITKNSKAADVFLLSEMANFTFLMAKESYDVEGMNKAIANLIKIKGLDKDDTDVLSEEDMREHNYFMIIPVDGEMRKVEMTCLSEVPNIGQSLLNKICDNITDVEAIEIMKK